MKKTLKILIGIFLVYLVQLVMAQETNFVKASITTTPKFDFTLILLIGAFVLLAILIFVIFFVLLKKAYLMPLVIPDLHYAWNS